jgi:hypothetical protein
VTRVPDVVGGVLIATFLSQDQIGQLESRISAIVAGRI